MKTVDEILRDLKGIGVNASMVGEELGVSKAAMSRFRKGIPTLSAEKVAQFHAIYERHMRDAPRKARKITAASDRHAEIIAMAAEGKTYEEIGSVMDISRQRVQQILAKHNAPRRQR